MKYKSAHMRVLLPAGACWLAHSPDRTARQEMQLDDAFDPAVAPTSMATAQESFFRGDNQRLVRVYARCQCPLR